MNSEASTASDLEMSFLHVVNCEGKLYKSDRKP